MIDSWNVKCDFLRKRMNIYKPFILVLRDHDESILHSTITRALKDKFIIFSVTSNSVAWNLLQNIIPDCIILDLSSAEAFAIQKYIRSLKFELPVLAFASSPFSIQVSSEIELHSNETLNDPSTLRDIVETAMKFPNHVQGEGAATIVPNTESSGETN
jgi:hypothetical protein